MSTASKAALEELHTALARTLAAAVTTGVPVVDAETGVVTRAPAPAALLAVARQFLKDNNIEADSKANSDLKSLLEGLPFEGSDGAPH